MVSREYWASLTEPPLAPSDNDVDIFRSNLLNGETLLLGVTRKLMPLCDKAMDIDPFEVNEKVVIQDWVTNTNFYTNMIIDGGLCLNKQLCDEVLKMASKNCKRFISRNFNYRLPTMQVAQHFPNKFDFSIVPNKEIVFDLYTFYIWDF